MQNRRAVLRADIILRILSGAVDTHLKMQMRSGRIAGRTDITDRLALGHVISDAASDAGHMRIQSRIAVAVVDNDIVAIAPVSRRDYDRPGLCCDNRRAVYAAAGNVNTGMVAAPSGTESRSNR